MYRTSSTVIPTNRIESLLDDVLGDAFGDLFDKMEKISLVADSRGSNFPPHDIFEGEDGLYYVQVAVAGYKREWINVTFDEGILRLTADERPPVIGKFSYRGIARRPINRAFRLSPALELVECVLADGLLTISFKQRASAAPTKVEIK